MSRAGPAPRPGGPCSQPAAEADAELMRRVAQGDEAAATELYERFVRQAFAVALRVLGERAAAEDAVQESFLKLWRSAARFDPRRGRLSSWVLHIAHRTAIDLLRRRSSAAAAPAEPTTVAALEEAAARGDPVADTAGAAEARLLGRAARAAIARLHPEQRRALELAYFGGMTHQEIARLTGAPIGTVKSRLRLALEHLRRTILGEREVTGR